MLLEWVKENKINSKNWNFWVNYNSKLNKEEVKIYLRLMNTIIKNNN